MHIAIVARDVGPSKGLDMLAKGLVEQGETVTSCLGFGKEMETSPRQIVGWVQVGVFDLIVCGMSSSELLAAEELAAAQAATVAGIPVILYADAWGVVNRPWFREVKPRGIFAVNSEELQKAQNSFIGFDGIVTGNPQWEKFFLSPELSREQWRKSWALNRPLILNVWGKDPCVNIAIASALVDANAKDRWDLRVQKHPGDRTPDEVYKSLADFGRLGWADGNLVPYADIVVESASTVGIEAACRRIPAISVFSELATRRLEKTTGSREWPLCQCGCSLRTSVGRLGSAIEQLMLCPDLLTANQEQMFPALKQGEAVGRMTRYIKSTFG